MMTLDEIQANIDGLCVPYQRQESQILVKGYAKNDYLTLAPHENGIAVGFVCDNNQNGGYMSLGVKTWDETLAELKNLTRWR